MIAIYPRNQKRIIQKRETKNQVEKIEYPVFVPNPGGQEKLFKRIPLNQEYTDRVRWFYFRGGVNGGKSWAGAAFVVSRTIIDPFARGLITANSYGQLETSTLVVLVNYCKTYGHQITVGQNKREISSNPDMAAKTIAFNRGCFIDGVFCLVLSSDAFEGKTAKSKEAGRGLQIRWCWYDEAAYGSKNIFDTINTRLGRGEGSHKALGLLTSSINKNKPYNYLYDYFDDPDRDHALYDIHETITVTTTENIYQDDDYVKSLEATYTKELIAIELRAEYASVGEGRVYSYFNRNHHCAELDLDLHLPIHLSLDFNHHPSTAIASQQLPQTKEIIILKEWFLEYSDTFCLSEELVKWLLEVKGIRTRKHLENKAIWNSFVVNLWGDATGNQKTANSKNSNWEIVKETFKKNNILFTIKYGKSNPSVLDSVNSVNCGFRANKVWIHPNCKELLKDYESLKWDENGNIDKKSDLMRSHVSDCSRYQIHGLLPYDRTERPNKSRQSVPVGVLL